MAAPLIQASRRDLPQKMRGAEISKHLLPLFLDGDRAARVRFMALATVTYDRLWDWTDGKIQPVKGYWRLVVDTKYIHDIHAYRTTIADVNAAEAEFENFCNTLIPGSELGVWDIACGFTEAFLWICDWVPDLKKGP